MKLHKKLHLLREKRGVSIDAVGKAVGATKSLTHNWFNGTSTPRLNEAAELANYFDVSLDYLASDDENAAPRSAADLTTEQRAVLQCWANSRTSMEEGMRRLARDPDALVSRTLTPAQVDAENRESDRLLELSKRQNRAWDRKAAQ